MAFAAAKYLFTRANPDRNVPTMVLEDLETTHPLLASGKDVLQQTVEANASRAHSCALVKVSFGSRDTGSSSVHKHGSCAVRVSKAVKLRANHHVTSREAKAKMDGLIATAKTGQQLRLPKLIVYKLFASLVDYKAAYQRMDEVYLDSSHKDAAASVRLTDNQNIGTLTCNP
ncbi:hypothetical protein N7G274_001573 [Stereocaulon virgatum]|uniref:PKS/mFAS DH domain-containing protein n=1 Tax=Stereocaulon virgatum TaxID=373712 RepID=A0ABR4AMU6_9LECA